MPHRASMPANPRHRRVLSLFLAPQIYLGGHPLNVLIFDLFMLFSAHKGLIDNWEFRLKTPTKYWKPATGQ